MSESIKLLSIVGARPQFIKLAPISRAADEHSVIDHQVIHTGQHYDESMSGSLFAQLELPPPNINLGVGSSSHGDQTAAMLSGIEQFLIRRVPDLVLTYGDTNSTLAATLAAAKMHIPVAHIEAGLRSFNRSMPEEINRLVSDHCSDRLYAPTPQAMENLNRENLQDRAVLSGDIMLDSVLHSFERAAAESKILDKLSIEAGKFGFVTVHRPVNTCSDSLKRLMARLESVAEAHFPLIFPLHPRTRTMIDELEYKVPTQLILLEPMQYLDSLVLIQAAAIVITDSGGVQKEAAFLRTPCLTLRDETEWTETVEIGINRLVGAEGKDLLAAIKQMLTIKDHFSGATKARIGEHYGDGRAAPRIINDCIEWLGHI